MVREGTLAAMMIQSSGLGLETEDGAHAPGRAWDRVPPPGAPVSRTRLRPTAPLRIG